MTYDFLKGDENNKSGTIFTLTGNVWGYDITLFNYYNEKEILLEPERKYKIDEILPAINNIIHIRCDFQDTPLILNNHGIKSKKSSNDPMKFDYLLKFVIIGDSSAGKSNILLYFNHGKFKEEYQLTIEPSFWLRNIEIKNKIYRLQIWDTTGQEKYRPIIRTFYKNSVCAIVVYNIADRNSFNSIPSWIEECKKQSPKTITMVLVGNVCESEDKREVSYEEGKNLADKNGIKFYEISSITGENINELFYNTTYEISKKIEEGYYDLNDSNDVIKCWNKENDIILDKPQKNSNCMIV